MMVDAITVRATRIRALHREIEETAIELARLKRDLKTAERDARLAASGRTVQEREDEAAVSLVNDDEYQALLDDTERAQLRRAEQEGELEELRILVRVLTACLASGDDYVASVVLDGEDAP